MRAVNIVRAENVEGRIDVAAAVGAAAILMFVYDLAPGQSSSPYHYEYDEEWLLVVEGTVVVRTIGVWPPNEQDSLVFRRDTSVPWAHGEEGWDRGT